MEITNDNLLPHLKIALENIKAKYIESFYAWKINICYHKSLQTLMMANESNELESYQNREVLDHSYEIEIFSRHSNPLAMGQFAFTIDPMGNLEEQVLKTYQNSLEVGNKPWDFPSASNGKYEEVKTSDPLIKENHSKAHESLIFEVTKKVKSLSKVLVNSCELYTNLKTFYFENSSGLNGKKQISDVYFEMAMEKLPLPNTQEVLKYRKSLCIEDAALTKFIDEVADETLSIAESRLPKTSSSCHVLVDAESISSLLSSVVAQLDGIREYEKYPFLKKGDQVFSGEKKNGSDKLSIILDPSIPVMALSTPYTADGMRPIKSEIIKDDVVTTQIIHNKMGQYLSKVPNYIAGNMVIEGGKMSKNELLNSTEECLEVIEFSSLLVNPLTLTWSSEIKLGKRYIKGKFIEIIKGGVLSGSIKENLCDFNFSKEIIKINQVAQGYSTAKGYFGPQFMLIKSGIKAVGE